MGTCTKAILGFTPMIIDFLQNRITSLLLGALAAYWVASRAMTRDEIDKSGNKALESAGIVMLITGAGGSFGAVISATGIGQLIQGMIGTSTGSVLPALLIAYFVAMVLRVSLGSGTVASITAMNIMAPVVIGLPVHPVYVAIACLAGGCSLGHVNDSGFWVVTNMSGFNLTGGVKSYSLSCIVMSLTYLILLVIMSAVYPMAPVV